LLIHIEKKAEKFAEIDKIKKMNSLSLNIVRYLLLIDFKSNGSLSLSGIVSGNIFELKKIAIAA